jgi:hypothetical protein
MSLNQSQVLILKFLAKHPDGVSAEKISTALGDGIAVNAETLGPVFRETAENHPTSLIGLGLARSKKEDKETVYLPTPKGVTLSAKVSAREPNGHEKIPNKELDRAVIAVKDFKAYGFELYTKNDLEEVRTHLTKKYPKIGDDALRLLICNRRKQGAFTDPAEKVKRAAKATLVAFGPDGVIKKGLLAKETVTKLEALTV